MGIHRTRFHCNRHHVTASFYLNECSITFMKDWILRKVVLSTGRKFIPVGEEMTYSVNQKENKNYIFRILWATPGDYRVDSTWQYRHLSTLLEGLKKKNNNVSYQLVIWESCSHILFAQGHFCLSLLMILLEDEVPRPLPIGQVIFNSYLPSKKICLSQTSGQDFFSEPHGS